MEVDNNTVALVTSLNQALTDIAKKANDPEVDDMQGLILIMIDKAGNSIVTIAGQIHKQLAMGCCLEAAGIINDTMKERQMKQMIQEQLAQVEKIVTKPPGH